MAGIARFDVVALDCPDPDALAAFYGAVTGSEVGEVEAGGEWVQLRSDAGAAIAFQRVEDYRPPAWAGSDRPQQAHLDFAVTDLDAAEEQVLALGARKAEFQPSEHFRVFLDPAGHPFCLVHRPRRAP